MDLKGEMAKLGIEFDLGLHLSIFFPVLARMIGTSLPIPFMGGNLIPGRIKFGVPLFFSVFMHPFIFATVDREMVPEVGFAIVGHIVMNLFIGYCIGFVVSLPFHAISVAGAFMDTQRGTTFAQVINPGMGGQTTLLGQFLNMLFIAVFLSLGGFLIVFDGLRQSYEAFPLYGGTYPLLHPNAAAAEQFIVHTGEVFTIGVKLAAPVVLSMFLIDATLGIVNRTAPNIQVFFLGMPVKALAGLVVVLIMMGFAHEQIAMLMADLAYTLRHMIITMTAT